jgi:hypothetical protein
MHAFCFLLWGLLVVLNAQPFGSAEGEVRHLQPTYRRKRKPVKGLSSWKVLQKPRNKLFQVGAADSQMTYLQFKAYILFNPSGELASEKSLPTMCKIWESWVRPNVELTLAIPRNAKEVIHRLKDQCSSEVQRMIVHEDEAYPPVKLELAMWRQAAERLSSSDTKERTFFIKLDMDAHFNPHALLRESARIKMTKHDYFGAPGTGRHNEYKKQPYCQGFSYFIRATAMQAFINEHPPLPPNIVNSDVAVGYVLGQVCQPLKRIGLDAALLTNNFMAVNKDGKVVQRQLRGEGFGDNLQMQLAMFPAPPTGELTAIAIHPIKSTAEFARFNEQIEIGLRPPLHGVSGPMRVTPAAGVDGSGKDYKRFIGLYKKAFRASCVANVADQISREYEMLAPCFYRTTTAGSFPLRGASLAVLTPNVNATKGYLTPFSTAHGLLLNIIQMATASVSAEKTAMRRVLASFVKMKSESLLVVTRDSVRFQPDLSARYARLDSYCFDGLATSGVLVLGTAVQSAGTFSIAKMKTHTLYGNAVAGANLNRFEQSQTGSVCHSGHAAAVNAHATIYSRGAAKYVLKWLSTKNSLAYNQVFAHLALLGIPIRIANPPLVVPDRRARAQWQLDKAALTEPIAPVPHFIDSWS